MDSGDQSNASPDGGADFNFQVVNNPPVVIKTEGKADHAEAMETDISDGQTSQLSTSDFAALENIEVELGKIQGAGDGDGAVTQVSTQTAQPSSSSNMVRVTAPGGVLSQAGTANIVTLQNNQVILSKPDSAAGTSVQTLRRVSSSAGDAVGIGGQTLTKMIITKNVGSQQFAGTVSTKVGHTPTQVIVTTTAAATSLLSHPQTPPKETYRVVMSNTGVFSPQKILTNPTTPTKQILPAGKLPISPLKSPTKITMVPVVKSPQKGGIRPTQIITMMGRSVISGAATSSTVSLATAKPQTTTLSPSKVIIKKQQISMPGGQQSMVAQQLSAPTLKSSSVVSIAGASGNVQPLTVSGNKFQYVRLVTTPASQSQTTTVKTATIAPAPTATIAKSAAPIAPIKIMPVNTPQQVVSRPALNPSLASVINQNQRVILPATSQVSIRPSIQAQPTFAQIRPSPAAAGASNTLSQLPPGTTIISSGQNVSGVQGFALVPAQYVPQLQQQFIQQQKSDTYIPISTSGPVPASSHARHNGASESSSTRQRKPCNCTKSQCLKLYCDCFANGEFCNNCNCVNCYNNLDHEEERGRAIKSCLERNPLAFHPKIGKGKGKGDRDRRHNKGCNCKRSGCLKNYCECYEAKILCSTLCKCCGCKNFEESPDRKTLMHLADAAEVRVQQQTAATTKLSSQIRDLPPRAPPAATGERPAYTFMTTDVAEATCTCLIAQAEEAERTRQIEATQERMILEEFGRCLLQVIESANKTKVSASSSAS